MAASSSAPAPSSVENFDGFRLSSKLIAQTRRAGLKEPTPIQKVAIPLLLEGKDAEILAPTGTGKTASYLLPVLDFLERRKNAGALVIVPTRELARQVSEMGKTLAPSHEFLPWAVYGGEQEGAPPTEDPRLIVATPGRLLDLLRSERLDATSCRFIVLDEGDRLMSGEFREEMLAIEALLPRERQTVLVSATGSPQTREAARSFLHKPVQIEPVEEERPQVRQAMIFVDQARKPLVLEALLRKHPDRSAIVFVATRDDVHTLTRHLRKQKLKVAELHGKLGQPARNAAISAFSSSKVSILVATDIAARGLDIGQVEQVINAAPPEQADTYLHRIGRTGRAGRKGWAVTLCAPEERRALRNIEASLGVKLKVLPIPEPLSRSR
ncbi:DEAD/DEAH box helicase [Acetobacter estunensis]|uniref:DEAD/DEAH box helicase n=1 Tax=Acetobacter estunensis TaxID=104097 RepID=UPI001C2CEFEE|nr:DEAD/DEAH box helicase [Acetobacter estunensis]MBV1837614.1 DEAD/DEAH box helicase [Acetobacter estunensis]